MNKNFHTHVGVLPTADIPNCGDTLLRRLVGSDGHLLMCADRAEATATVLMGHFIDQLADSGKTHVLTSNVEDAPALLALERLEPLGCFAKKVSVSGQGFVSADDVKKYITPRTGLVSLSWANALTGVVQPIASIAKVCQEAGVPLHVDATHAAGRMQVSMQDVDFLTWEGMVFSKERLQPIVAGRACDPQQILDAEKRAERLIDNLDHVAIESARIRDAFEMRVKGDVLFADAERLPGISCVSFGKMTSELLAFHLKHKGFDVSFGGGVFQNIEHIVRAAGCDARAAKSALTFCFTPESDHKALLSALEQIL